VLNAKARLTWGPGLGLCGGDAVLRVSLQMCAKEPTAPMGSGTWNRVGNTCGVTASMAESGGRSL